MTLADLRCMHGVLHVRGTVRLLRGASATNVQTEMELIGRVLRQKAEIRDVILEYVYRQ